MNAHVRTLYEPKGVKSGPISGPYSLWEGERALRVERTEVL